MKNIYTAIMNREMQKSHPFGLAENRFTWVKIYCNGNDLKNHRRLYNKNVRKDNLEGGIGRYLSRNKMENKKELENNILRNSMDYDNQKKRKYIFQSFDSKRVINPEKDTEIQKVSKKKTFEGIKNNLFFRTDGTITSLFQKTPLKTRNKGKKILSNSVDYGRKGDTNLFSDDFLNDKQYNIIPGIMRKHRIHQINNCQKPLNSNNKKKHINKK